MKESRCRDYVPGCYVAFGCDRHMERFVNDLTDWMAGALYMGCALLSVFIK